MIFQSIKQFLFLFSFFMISTFFTPRGMFASRQIFNPSDTTRGPIVDAINQIERTIKKLKDKVDRIEDDTQAIRENTETENTEAIEIESTLDEILNDTDSILEKTCTILSINEEIASVADVIVEKTCAIENTVTQIDDNIIILQDTVDEIDLNLIDLTETANETLATSIEILIQLTAFDVIESQIDSLQAIVLSRFDALEQSICDKLQP